MSVVSEFSIIYIYIYRKIILWNIDLVLGKRRKMPVDKYVFLEKEEKKGE